MTLVDFTDEILMAYADGELDEPAARRVEMAMGADPAISARVVAFLRSRRLAKAAYAAPADVEVPEALRKAIEADMAAFRERSGPVLPAADNVVAFPRKTEGGRPFLRSMMAAAAAVVAAVGIVYGTFGWQSKSAMEMNLAELDHPEVVEKLATLASGDTAHLGNTAMTAVESFAGQGGELCRSFDLTDPDSRTQAVACRAGTSWQVRFAMVGPAPKATEGYDTASGDEALSNYLSSIDAGPAMDKAAEAEALAALGKP
ncbi:anti-sigma factor family protein [Oryzibacter oryziterrae]|uniref:anti-sigma factor family protein n=1 Tax=Oryzibacter oryziterrae TaxID=2766474 RepID=UPI001F29A819|nr:hypothetical protein [Oryzibacter oryziterrae]